MHLVPWFIAAILLLIHLSIAIGYTGLLEWAGIAVTPGAALYWLLVAACGLYLVLGMAKRTIRKSRGFTIGNLAVLVPLAIFLGWILTDETPLTDDYAAADLITSANGSYRYLDIFNQSDPEELESVRTALDDPTQIDAAWDRIINYRRAVDALDHFDAICDLPPDTALDLDVPFLKYQALRNTADIYHRYLIYKVGQGQGTAAAQDISHFYGFTRKSLSSATLLIHKVLFLSLADRSLNAVYEAIGHSRCDPQTIQAFQQIYSPLNSEEFGLVRAITGEYLFIKNSMHQQVTPDTFLDAIMISPTGETTDSAGYPLASRAAYYIGFKPNMSLRSIKRVFDLMIEAQKASPPDFSKVARLIENYRQQPQLRNMAGWALNTMAMPDFATYSARAVNTKIRSDLLAIALHQKTDQPIEIKDYYTGEPCRYRQDPDAMRHPGPDGRFDTEDDIILGTLARK